MLLMFFGYAVGTSSPWWALLWFILWAVSNS
jgi:hypothetical protein